MNRVASLFLPQLPIERLRAEERSRRPPEPAQLTAAALAPPIDDNPGACSVPRGGGWRPGARWSDRCETAYPRDSSFPKARTLPSPPFGSIQEQEEILRIRSHDFH